MEPVGLVVGVVGLASLFESCLAAFERVDTYRQYGTTSRQLQTRFENQKFILEQWGERIRPLVRIDKKDTENLYDDSLEGKRCKRIEATLVCINDALHAINGHFERNSHSSPATAIPLPGNIERSSRWTKLKWAVGDKQRLTEQIEWFEVMVQNLNDLQAASQSPNTRSTGQADEASRDLPPAYGSDIDSLKSWLNALSSRAIFDQSLTSRADGTCQWLTTQSKYQSWLDPDSKQSTLWLHGPAGFGKSVISAATAQNLENGTRTVLAYFCSATRDELRMPSNILRSCLLQAILKRPDILQVVQKTKDKSESKVASDAELSQLFHTMTHMQPGVVCVVDGYDECVEYESDIDKKFGITRSSFLKQFREYFTNTSSRLLLISRDEQDLRMALCLDGSQTASDLTQYQIEKSDVGADIERFCAQQINNFLASKPAELRDELIKDVSEKSGGMFLWVRLQTNQMKPSMTATRLWKQMADMPKDLQAVYEVEWQRILSNDTYERERAMLMLRWITFAARPLTAGELFEAIAIRADDSPPALSELDWPLDDEITVELISEQLKLCNPFLVLRQDPDAAFGRTKTIEIAHFSMIDFLLEKFSVNSMGDGRPHIDINLAISCTTYLAYGLACTDNNNSSPFMTYVSKNWKTHLSHDILELPRVQEILSWGFSNHNPHWMKWRDTFETVIAKESPAILSPGWEYKVAIPGDRTYYAALYGLSYVLESLMGESDRDVNAISGRYGTALMAAIANDHISAVNVLLDAGANINLRAGLFGSALNTAIACQHDQLVELLLKRGADHNVIDELGRDALFTAALHGSETTIRILIKAGAPLHRQNLNKLTPLSAAAWKCNTKAVKTLLDVGADVNFCCSGGYTALMYATDAGHNEIIKCLVTAGADVNAENESGWTPLSYAAHRGNAIVARLFLDARADINHVDEDESTALYIAADNGHTEVLKLLLDAGAKTKSQNRGGWTPINAASSEGHIECVRVLIVAKADVNIPNREGTTPVYSAIANRNEALVELLGNAGADLELANNLGKTCLISATDIDHLPTVRTLLRLGARVNHPNKNQWTALHYACWRGHSDIVVVLLKAGADQTFLNDEGLTALAVACTYGRTDTVKAMITAGADTNVKNQDGSNALDTAQRHGHVTCIEILS